MDTFLETYNLLRLNQEKIENLTRPTTSNETVSVIKKFPNKKSPGPDRFTEEFYQIFQEKLISIFIKLFPQIAEDGIILNSF